MNDCHCGCDCFEPIELVSDEADRIVILRAEERLTSEQVRKARKQLEKRFRKAGIFWPVVVLTPGFELDTVIV